jgi:hypothetical protein
MIHTGAYEDDLAYIHDQGFGESARESAPGLLKGVRQNGISEGLVVGLGGGSEIWAKKLADCGYQVMGAYRTGRQFRWCSREVRASRGGPAGWPKGMGVRLLAVPRSMCLEECAWRVGASGRPSNPYRIPIRSGSTHVDGVACGRVKPPSETLAPTSFGHPMVPLF